MDSHPAVCLCAGLCVICVERRVDMEGHPICVYMCWRVDVEGHPIIMCLYVLEGRRGRSPYNYVFTRWTCANCTTATSIAWRTEGP